MRRHHYLPRTYLKGFAVKPDCTQIVVIRTGSGKSFRSGLKRVARQHGFYRVRTHPPETEERAESVENELGKIEAGFAAARDRLTRDGTIGPGKDFSFLVAFIALLRTRTPAARVDREKALDAIMKAELAALICDPERRGEAVKWYVSTGRGDADAANASIDWLCDFANFKVSPSQNQWVEEMLGNASNFTDVFLKMKWSVVCAIGRYGFITSDFPVAIAAPNAVLDHGLDLRDRACEVTCPITSKFALVGRWTYERDTRANTGRVDEINRRTSWASHQFLYADTLHPRYVAYAQHFSGAPRLLLCLPERIDDDVARRGRVKVGFHMLPVPWNPSRRTVVVDAPEVR